MKPFSIALASLALACSSVALSQRLMTVDDVASLARLQDPKVSPDGNWVTYAVVTTDQEKDRPLSAVWIASWDGTRQIKLTQGHESATSPQWSPDGRWVSFLRKGPAKDVVKQVWVMDRRGGEAQPITDVRGELTEYSWSPDSKRLALVIREDEPGSDAIPEDDGEKRPVPLVINRYQFKSDEDGYHSKTEYLRVFLYDISTRALTALTGSKAFKEFGPAWSPDGERIAFVSNRDEDWDRTENHDLWVAEARPGAPLRKLTTFHGDDDPPLAWSPDGRSIAYVQGSDPKFYIYNYYQLGIASTDGSSAVRLPTQELDRDIDVPQFSPDGRSLLFRVTDNRTEYLGRMPLAGGKVEQLTRGPHVMLRVAVSPHSPERIVVLHGTSTAMPELFAFEKGKLRKLTHHNDALMSALTLATTEDFGFRARDGAEVFGLLTKPPGRQAAKKYPTILWIHGGPYKQSAHNFDLERQLLAAQGYLIVQVNYRGSSGRGTPFARTIFGDWGNKDATDLIDGIDHVIRLGLADPDRLGVGGWSQGGILTNYVIARDPRFKAATSGAGVANQFGIYGHDQYVFQYDNEFGQPWAHPEVWTRISYPFFQADRIHAAVLYLGGDRDFNVPVIGGEQMYQALKSLGRTTQLVVYPGEHHAITRPSFVRDRYERYIAWFAKYLK